MRDYTELLLMMAFVVLGVIVEGVGVSTLGSNSSPVFVLSVVLVWPLLMSLMSSAFYVLLLPEGILSDTGILKYILVAILNFLTMTFMVANKVEYLVVTAGIFFSIFTYDLVHKYLIPPKSVAQEI